MSLSIVIVNWNSRDYVRGCLASLRAHCPSPPCEIVVVDSASYDGCGRMLAEEFPDVLYVQSTENIGFARANNLGASRASGENLLFLNPDTAFSENTLAVLLGRLTSLPQAAAVGCRLLNRDGSVQSSCLQSFPTVLNQALDSEYLRRRFPRSSLWGMAPLHSAAAGPAEVEVLSGACIMATRAAFAGVGGFTEDYPMYAEDLDLCFKLRRAGGRVYYVPETSLTHFGGGSSARAASDFSTLMMHASVHRFMRLHRGALPAFAYRATMAVSALVRLALMLPLMLFGRRVVRHGFDSFRKWSAILRWSIGVAPRAVLPGTAAAPAAVTAHGHS